MAWLGWGGKHFTIDGGISVSPGNDIHGVASGSSLHTKTQTSPTKLKHSNGAENTSKNFSWQRFWKAWSLTRKPSMHLLSLSFKMIFYSIFFFKMPSKIIYSNLKDGHYLMHCGCVENPVDEFRFSCFPLSLWFPSHFENLFLFRISWDVNEKRHFIFNFIFIYFMFMSVSSACVSVHHVSQVLFKVRRGCWIAWGSSYR